jgi:hypothetical protein
MCVFHFLWMNKYSKSDHCGYLLLCLSWHEVVFAATETHVRMNQHCPFRDREAKDSKRKEWPVNQRPSAFTILKSSNAFEAISSCEISWGGIKAQPILL